MPEQLDILHEDDDLITVFKPAGHMVHPADNPQEEDLVALKILRDQINQHLYPVHRIDRPTCGVLLFAKNKQTAKILIRKFESQEIKKVYWAVILGAPEQEHWECNEALQKQETKPFQEAHTSFSLLKSIEPKGLANHTTKTISLIEAKPTTGRYHQIRKHLLFNKTPIVGDYFYAGIEISDTSGALLGTETRMLLQAKELSFAHPYTKEQITITSHLDEAFVKVLGGDNPY